MAGTLKKVRFKLAWQNWRVGDEFVPTGTERDWLVDNGYAEIVEAETPGRPAKLGARAAQKLSVGTRSLIG